MSEKQRKRLALLFQNIKYQPSERKPEGQKNNQFASIKDKSERKQKHGIKTAGLFCRYNRLCGHITKQCDVLKKAAGILSRKETYKSLDSNMDEKHAERKDTFIYAYSK